MIEVTVDAWPLRVAVGGEGELVILLHGGGPDHHSMRPLAQRLAGRYLVALPDIRGYGASICRDPALHRWDRYVADVIAVMAALDATSAHLIGAGLGGTIALRTSLAHPAKVRSAVIISAEAIEDDGAKAAETALMDRFAACVRTHGLQAGWDLFIPHLQPLIAHLVTEAIPRADPQSAAAAAAIGHDRAFRDACELADISTPTLIIAGDDARHPLDTARAVADALPYGVLAEVTMSESLLTAQDLAEAFAPAIEQFLTALPGADRHGRAGR
ncbi:alpha/beta hydrolase [Mycobacterium sp. AMU20-3851]|uniref:alpha/beta fold hydrolase n=1 Tax=Mycobacterium sp. AMU20-3851 TaxID=3122055 RepID=UPI00375418B6